MNIVLRWLAQMERSTVPGLQALCAAIVSQFEDIATASNTWARKDHNLDGTHYVVRVGGTTAAPTATTGRITIYVDGSDLKVVRADGTIGTITIV